MMKMTDVNGLLHHTRPRGRRDLLRCEQPRCRQVQELVRADIDRAQRRLMHACSVAQRSARGKFLLTTPVNAHELGQLG